MVALRLVEQIKHAGGIGLGDLGLSTKTRRVDEMGPEVVKLVENRGLERYNIEEVRACIVRDNLDSLNPCTMHSHGDSKFPTGHAL